MPEMTMKQFNNKLQKWAAKFPEDAKKAISEAAMLVHNEVITNHLNGPKMAKGVGSSTNGTLQPRSGDLKSSISFRVKKSGHRITGQVGNWKHPLKYARIHEYGGTIKHPGGTPYNIWFGRMIFMKKDTIFSMGITKPHDIKIPERSFLRSSLNDKRDKIKEILLKAIKRSYTNA